MTPTLAGKRALITGSSKGVGLAAARVFVAQGAQVVMHANTTAASARAAAADIVWFHIESVNCRSPSASEP